MGKGYITVKTTDGGAPIGGITATVRDIRGTAIYEGQTDTNGHIKPVAVEAPDAANTLRQEETGPFFTIVDVETSDTPHYAPMIIRNVPVFDGVTSEQPLLLSPSGKDDSPRQPCEIALPPVFGVQMPHAQQGSSLKTHGSPWPESIVVHMGRPTSNAPDITIPFVEYIKTVASCEMYPTWPETALEANLYCILSVALHRIYSGWYRRQGYPFDITASVAHDPFYIHNRPIFDNISDIVNRILDAYPSRRSRQGLYFTPYCNGSTSACSGFSQWGSVALAAKGLCPADILSYYFGPDIIWTWREISKKQAAPFGAAIGLIFASRYLRSMTCGG